MPSEPAPPLYMQAWVALLGAHARLVPRVSQELEARHGISLAWFDVLFQLGRVPAAELRMHQLGAALLLSKGGISRLVDRIEQARLVARAAVPGDRRSLYVRLTPSGRRLLEQAQPVVQQAVADHFARQFTEAELATLRDVLGRCAFGTASAEPTHEQAGSDPCIDGPPNRAPRS